MHGNSHFFHFFRNRELNEIYVSVSIRAFALSLIGIFAPIFLYVHGFTISTIFFFYAMVYFVHMIFAVPAAKMASKYGVKHTILLSAPFLITYLMLLYSLDKFNWSLPFMALVSGLSTSFFWIPYHIDFAKFSNKKNRGKQIGIAGLSSSLLSVAGPFIGGLLVIFLGFQTLFLIASILIFAAVLPLFFSQEFHEESKFSLHGFFQNQKKKDIISFLGHGIENKMGGVVWPLFMFIFIFKETYTYIGGLSSLVSGAAFLSTILVGRFSDGHRKKTLKFGSVFNSLVWFGRSFIVTPIQLLFTEPLYGASTVSMNIPFDAMNYDKAKEKKHKIAKMILEREIYHCIGAVTMLLTLALLTQYIPDAFRFGGPISSLMRFFF